MIESIFFVLWFFSPAGLANLAAFSSGKIGFLKRFNYPVDGFVKFRGKRLLGSHKTVRGFVVGVVVSIFACYVQVFLYDHVLLLRQILPLDYHMIQPVLLGILFGFGALTGDAVKSFFKRQMKIQPGKSWFPYDQIDYILGGIFFTWFYLKLPVIFYIMILVIWFVIHLVMAFIGYLFKLRHQPM